MGALKKNMWLRARYSFVWLGLAFLIAAGCGTDSAEPETGTVAAPAISPGAGTYSSALDIAITTATADAAIRYTTDGSVPTTTAGTVYAGPVHVAESQTVKAVAYKTGWTTSAVTSAQFTIAPLVAAPVFDPAPGTYATVQDVAITTSTDGASIRYTTDGSTPTAAYGTAYAGPVHIAGTLTLKAAAYRAGWTTSHVASGQYAAGPVVSAPEFAPPPGDYLDPQDITISTSTAGAAIRYTTDGSTPSDTAGTPYTGPVHVAGSLTLKAVAFQAEWRNSPVTAGDYTIGLHAAAPEFSPAPGTYAAAQDIVITSATAGAAIRYTTDGSTPTETAGTVYTAPVHLASSVTLRAVAYLAGWTASQVTTGAYAIGQTVMAPAFSVPPGTYATAKNVAITTTTAEATIRTTTDGSTPTETAGTVYTSPVRVARSLTLRAVAYRTGWTTSSVTSGEYKRVGIDAGTFHTILAKADGTVWTWGGNFEGQIGDGTSNPRQEPGRVTGIAGIVAVAAGYNHSIALKSDGTVWTWGRNMFGQLGDGTTNQRSEPVQVQGIADVVAVAVGENSTYALKSDGTVWGWGRNGDGQLGDGTTTDRSSPVLVQGLSNVAAIAAGAVHAAAVRGDGTVWTWGGNIYGALGDGTTTTRPTPAPVPGLTGMVGVAADGYHTAAVMDDGTLWTWGSGIYGELGNGDQPLVWPNPVKALDLSGAAAVAAGTDQTIALLGDGTLRACGFNYYGQLGDGTNTDRSVAVPVLNLSGVVAVGASIYHTVAVLNDGTVWAWGHNASYQLGDGTTNDRLTPVRIIR
jgi:alpha-tubulin suppressor-like RCC1 family protein